MIFSIFGLPMQLPRTEAALRDVHSASAEMRWVAAMALSREDGRDRPRAVEALAALTADPNEDVRAQAIEGLANHAREGAAVDASPVAIWLEDPSDLVRCAALSNADAFALDAGPLADRMIMDASPAARATAAHVLGLLEARDRADALAGLLDDPNQTVRREAALSLSRLGDLRGVALATALIEAGGEDAVEAAMALGQSGTSICVGPLRGLLTRRFTPVEVKAVAAAALSRAGDASGHAAIAQMLGSWRGRTRFAAASAVAALPSGTLAEHMAERIGKAEALEASVLIQTLAAIGEEAPDAALAAMRGALERGSFAAGIEEELRDAIRALGARDR
jgi:HEAT repeat protein